MIDKRYANKPITILFDLDGTLIDSTEAILDSFAYSFKILGGSLPDAGLIKAKVGYPLADIYRDLGVEEERIEEYVRVYKNRYSKVHSDKTVLLPKAKEAIEMAASFARLGIVTSKTGLYSRELMEHFGLMGYFDALIGSEDVERHKPHPEPIIKALERMGCPKDGCWMVGDTCLDIEAAKRAGVEAIGLLCGYGKAKHLRECASLLESNALSAVTLIAQRNSLPLGKRLF